MYFCLFSLSLSLRSFSGYIDRQSVFTGTKKSKSINQLENSVIMIETVQHIPGYISEETKNIANGLTEKEVRNLQLEFGKNVLQINSSKRIFRILWDILREPMFLLLLLA